ncbi:MAG: JAB domain-containing protein [Thermodesulfobacteriota bacterium]
MTKYAYRLETKRVKDPDFPYVEENLNCPDAVAEFCRSLEDSDVEKMIVLHLTTKNRLIGIQVFPGTVDKAVIHPRELVKQSLLTGGTGIILVHNHPSGTFDPSPEDRALTEAIIGCAKLFDIRVLDHIILGENGFFSAKMAGWL